MAPDDTNIRYKLLHIYVNPRKYDKQRTQLYVQYKKREEGDYP